VKTKAVFFSLLAMSGVALAVSSPLKPPATLSTDFRTETWLGAAGAVYQYSSPFSGITISDTVSFVDEDPTPFLVWNPKTGISAFPTAYITSPDDIPPGPLWPGPLLVRPQEALVVDWASALTLGKIGNVTGVWLDGMKPGAVVDWGIDEGPEFAGFFGPSGPEVAVANKAGDAFLALPKGAESIALYAKAGTYDIAGLVDPLSKTGATLATITTAKVPEGGNLLMILGASFLGVVVLGRRA
jgi:hypothetical protein